MRIDNARIRWQDNGLPYSESFDDVYFSRQDELTESQHVFLQANSLLHRWQLQADSGGHFTIGELGFGCALNFLQTWHSFLAFRQSNPNSALRLHYIAIEKYPLTRADLLRTLAFWPQLEPLGDKLARQYPDHSAGCHRLILGKEVILDLHYGDAAECLQRLADSRLCNIDAWYADGFSPKVNPQMWQDSLFRLVARCSAGNATLSTYSVAGSVRQALSGAGFAIEKRPGHGNKRHMLLATLQRKPESPRSTTPWFDVSGLAMPDRIDKTVTIVGAGLAGCSLARFLARRGWSVRVLEARTGPMQGASGSGQLALRCRLIMENTPLARFYLHAFLFAGRLLGNLPNHEDFWHPCGVLQLESAMAGQRLKPGRDFQQTIQDLYDRAVVTVLEQTQATTLAGVELSDGPMLNFPLGGWVAPVALADTLLNHPRIQLDCQAEVSRIEFVDGHWQCQTGSVIESRSSHVVICNARDSLSLLPPQFLPLEGIRGQVSSIPRTAASATLRSVVTGARTVFPATADRHTLAASYQRNNTELAPRSSDDRDNLELARQCFSQQQLLANEVQSLHTALRCNSQDRRPLIGPVPDFEQMRRDYEMLSVDASLRPQIPGASLPGLFMSVAHGSNGLATCLLGSEYLASLMNAECPPLSREQIDSLHPARFLIRQLQRQQLP